MTDDERIYMEKLNLNNKLISVISRTEVISIVSDLINNVLAILQKDNERKIDDDVIQAIQACINQESEQTTKIYTEIEKIMSTDKN